MSVVPEAVASMPCPGEGVRVARWEGGGFSAGYHTQSLGADSHNTPGTALCLLWHLLKIWRQQWEDRARFQLVTDAT